jgi:DNA-binding NtrC family response regulator
MLEAVSVASRQLLVIDPCDECERLLPRVQAAGWALRRCRLDECDSLHGDVVLIRLGEALLLQPQGLLALLRRSAASCVALLDGPSLARSEVAELIGEWFFAAHALPCEAEALLESLVQAQATTRLRSLQGERHPRQFLGNSSQTRALRKQIERCAGLEAPLLLTGERGSGKALLARLLHERSARAGKLYLRFDCAAPPAAQLEARLFGEGGALAAAAGGTLVLEGVAALDGAGQRRLLQHLQAHPGLHLLTISRGELEEAVRQGRLRDDLYRLLASQQLQTTPLREHRGDLLLLAEYFAKVYGAVIGRRHRRFSDEAIDAMAEHLWPGNVRELCNRVVRALVLAQGRQILARDLGLEPGQEQSAAVATLADYILRAERQALNDVLARYANNMSQAARSLGISRPTFYRLLHKHRLR